MKFGIIADELTGANDCGVKFAAYDLRAVVALERQTTCAADTDVIVLDTDSRALDAEKAYEHVHDAFVAAKQHGVQCFYKKIDSTLRGNIVSELDALYDVLRPDFVIVAPAYPQNGRTVKDGQLYVHGALVSHTEFSQYRQESVREADIASVIGQQSARAVGHITKTDIDRGPSAIHHLLQTHYEKCRPYIVVDAVGADDMLQIVRHMLDSSYSVAWVGSAGLADSLPAVYGFKQVKRRPNPVPYTKYPSGTHCHWQCQQGNPAPNTSRTGRPAYGCARFAIECDSCQRCSMPPRKKCASVISCNHYYSLAVMSCFIRALRRR